MRNYSSKKLRRILGKYVIKKLQLNVADGVIVDINEVEDAYSLLDRTIAQEQCHPQPGPRAERFPYWAEVWPSAVALARWFWEIRPEPPAGEVWELGCGLGAVGIALAKLGWRVQATDFVEDALVFARMNALDNQVASRHQVGYLDWNHPVGRPSACLVASDVVYERKNHLPLAQVLRHLLLPGGRFYLSDPQRPLARSFATLLEDQGYTHQVESRLLNWRSKGQTVDIHLFTKPT